MPLWCTVGSVGVASAADQSKLVLHNSVVQLGSGIGGVLGAAAERGGLSPSSSSSGPELRTLGTQVAAVIRYGVDLTREDLAGTAGLRITYRDGDGIITARLIAVDFATGVQLPDLIIFDSRNYGAPKEAFVQKFATPPNGGPIVVSAQNVAFYIELTLAVFQRIGVQVAFPPAVAAMALGYETS